MNTLFHRTRLPLPKWFLAISLISNAKKGITSCQLAKELEVAVKTAWAIGHKIKRAMKEDNNNLLDGIVEMDETYILPRRKHKKTKQGKGTNKPAIIGSKQRDGVIRLFIANNNYLGHSVFSKILKNNTDLLKTTLYTDEYRGYDKMKEIIKHNRICRSKGVYSKKGVYGQYHS